MVWRGVGEETEVEAVGMRGVFLGSMVVRGV